MYGKMMRSTILDLFIKDLPFQSLVLFQYPTSVIHPDEILNPQHERRERARNNGNRGKGLGHYEEEKITTESW